MYQTYPVDKFIPNAIFAHGDIVLFQLFKGNVLMNSVELRAKDTASDVELPDDNRYKLFISGEKATIDARAWPVSRHEHDDMQYQLVKVLGNVHTPFYKACQGAR